MSYINFKEAMRLAPKCEFFTNDGGKTEFEIKKSEELLGIKFSKQCYEFYKEFGYLSFYGNEIFGIDPNDFDELEGNSVAYALNDREEYNLPAQWVPVYNFDDGNMAYLDYSKLNQDGEPRVIMAIYNGNSYEIIEELAEDFGEFLLERINDVL